MICLIRKLVNHIKLRGQMAHVPFYPKVGAKCSKIIFSYLSYIKRMHLFILYNYQSNPYIDMNARILPNFIIFGWIFSMWGQFSLAMPFCDNFYDLISLHASIRRAEISRCRPNSTNSVLWSLGVNLLGPMTYKCVNELGHHFFG